MRRDHRWARREREVSLTAIEIGRVVARLDRQLAGAVVRKAISPARPDRVVLELRRPGANELVQIVVTSDGARLARLPARPAAAPTPHPFVMLLRREIHGAVLARARQLGGDRVAALELRRGGQRFGTLVAELTSRHGNLFWLDAAGIIVGSLWPNRSHKRKLVPGAPYVPPLARADLKTHDRFGDGDDLEARIEAHYAAREDRADEEAARTAAARAIRSARKRLARLADRVEADRRRAEQAEGLQTMAHVLQANLYRVKRGDRQLDAHDFAGEPIRVPLDPALEPAANMQKLFERAKRLRRAAPHVAERLETIRVRLARIEALADRAEEADAEELERVVAELREHHPQDLARAQRRKRDSGRLPYREIPIAAGRPARVGRKAADNDALTLRHAKPDDLWLHVRGRGGSHVVVPMGRGEDPSAELLVDAAHLAAHFSSARREGDVEVTWTRRRYVQKPRGAAPGSVRLLQEKTILVRIEPARLARLLDRDQ